MARIIIALLCFLALPAGAAFGPDSIGFVLDPEASDGWDVALHTTSPFRQVEVYLVIAEPSLGGVSSWEARVETEGDAMGWAWDAGLVGLEWLGPEFLIEYGVGAKARRPNGSGLVVLLHGTGFIMSPDDEFRITVKGPPSYTHPDDLTIEQTLQVPVGDYALPCFVINAETPLNTIDSTWSHIKAAFGE